MLNVISAISHANRHVKESKELRKESRAEKVRKKAIHKRNKKRLYSMTSQYSHTINNLKQITHYCDLIKGLMVRGAAEPPAWVVQVVASAHADMRDVGHFMKREGKVFAKADSAYFLSKNVSDIKRYALMSNKMLKADIGKLPEWLTDKVAVISHDLDKIAHYLEFESENGRRYGVPGYSYGQPGWAGNGGVATICSIKNRRRQNRNPNSYSR